MARVLANVEFFRGARCRGLLDRLRQTLDEDLLGRQCHCRLHFEKLGVPNVPDVEGAEELGVLLVSGAAGEDRGAHSRVDFVGRRRPGRLRIA
jgi:hypothetical protein